MNVAEQILKQCLLCLNLLPEGKALIGYYWVLFFSILRMDKLLQQCVRQGLKFHSFPILASPTLAKISISGIVYNNCPRFFLGENFKSLVDANISFFPELSYIECFCPLNLTKKIECFCPLNLTKKIECFCPLNLTKKN